MESISQYTETNLCFPDIFGVGVTLVDQEIIRKHEEGNSRQVHLVKATGFVPAVSDESLITPRGAFPFKDDIRFVAMLVCQGPVYLPGRRLEVTHVV